MVEARKDEMVMEELITIVEAVKVDRFMTTVTREDITREDTCAVLATIVLTVNEDALALEITPFVANILEAVNEEMEAKLLLMVDPINVDNPNWLLTIKVEVMMDDVVALFPVSVDTFREDIDTVLAIREEVLSVVNETELTESVLALMDDAIMEFIRMVQVCIVDASITRA